MFIVAQLCSRNLLKNQKMIFVCFVEQALVPGAKPLSITEVRLSKDDEDEQISGKDRERKHNTSDSNGEYTVREETIAQKMEGPRKGDAKADNHIGKIPDKKYDLG